MLGVPGAGWRVRGPAAGDEPQLPTLAQPAYAAGQVCPALPVPAGDQLVQPGDVPGGERTGGAPGRDGRGPQHPGAHRGGQRGQRIDGQLRARARQPPRVLAGQLIEGLGVGPELAGGARERLGDARAQRVLQLLAPLP